MICQYRFTDCKKCTPLVWDFDSGEGCTCVGTGTLWKLYFQLNFAVNLNRSKKLFINFKKADVTFSHAVSPSTV